MTLNSLTCSAVPKSPISSKNNVPPLADSNKPAFAPAAPVKAPFSYPNISDSSN